MAATITQAPQLAGQSGLTASLNIVYFTFQGDSQYPAGGYPVTASQVGLTTKVWDANSLGAAVGGNFLAYDNTNNTMRVFSDPASTGAFTEYASSSNLSLINVNCWAIGF